MNGRSREIVIAAGSWLIADWNFCKWLSRFVFVVTVFVIAAMTPRSSLAAPVEYVIHLSVDGLRTGPDEDGQVFLQTAAPATCITEKKDCECTGCILVLNVQGGSGGNMVGKDPRWVGGSPACK